MRRLAAASALLLLLAAGCSRADPPPDSSGAPSPSTASSATSTATNGNPSGTEKPDTEHQNRIRHARVVVAISVDGLNPDAITALGPSGAPTFHWLMAHGATTLNARTEREWTRTLPNHTGMVTSRPVLGPEGHAITFNEDDGSTVGEHAGSYAASLFDVVHDSGGSTAFYSSKRKLDLLDRSWDGAHGALDTSGTDDGRDKIDRYSLADEQTNVDRLLRRLRTDPDELSFLHLAYPDSAGHAHGYMSPAYLRAVAQTDVLAGRVLAVIRNSAALSRTADLVVTADHGGRGPGHGDETELANYRIPFLVWGMGVRRGADLYSLNPTRRDPGGARTGYRGPQPIRNGDLGNLVTGLLGLPTIPGSVFDARHDLKTS